MKAGKKMQVTGPEFESAAFFPSLANECRGELVAITAWWLEHALDEVHGGFHGEIDAASQPVPAANKGIVLNSRLLWFFSELAGWSGKSAHRAVAERSYDYLQSHFFDPTYGGYYWEIDCAGNVVCDRKQVYAQAFCIYGLVSYFQMSQQPVVLEQATDIFELILSRCADPLRRGYIEAFSRSWDPIEDYRLSDLDRNLPKTMNTHLHLLEAFTSLHRVAPSRNTSAALQDCLHLFKKHILCPDDLRLRMFLDADWNDHSQETSFGHEIEFSWLVCEACRALADERLTNEFERLAVAMADRVLTQATGANGQVHERQAFGQPLHPESAWWVQAEALVGFLNAWQISSDSRFAAAFRATWEFIQRYHKTSPSSEWTWLPADENGRQQQEKYLAGFWKAPYHNGRAMMEVWRRLEKCESSKKS